MRSSLCWCVGDVGPNQLSLLEKKLSQKLAGGPSLSNLVVEKTEQLWFLVNLQQAAHFAKTT